MPTLKKIHPCFKKTSLAIAASLALMPTLSFALDLVESPPGTSEPYVRPNVVLTIDDSGSMGYRLDRESFSNVNNRTSPDLANGGWSNDSKRINVLKYALRAVFDSSHPDYDPDLLPNKKIRIGWQVMHNNGGAQDALSIDSGSGTTGSPTSNTNSVKILDSTHRTSLISFINSLSANNGTPSHQMFKYVDNYFRRDLSENGPWASEPGTTGEPYLGCRRNYHIFMTDGRWNGTASGGSQDDNTTNISLPDNTVFGSTNTNTRPYNNLYTDEFSNTLADWAFKSWSTRLQAAGKLQGEIQPDVNYRKSPETEDFGKDQNGKSAVLDRYWNPKYNPATWPHIVTYTIGFSKMAYTWPGDKKYTNKSNPSAPATACSNILAPGQGCDTSTNTATYSDFDLMLPFNYEKGSNGSLPDLITGNLSWKELKKNTENLNALDLWHAALNGRGRFYAVEQGKDLQKAFKDIFQKINAQTDPDFSSSATSGSNITRNSIGQYVAAYEPKNAWKGFLQGKTIKKDGSIENIPGWDNKNTADRIDATTPTNRVILSWKDSLDIDGGVAFRWHSTDKYLSDNQKKWLKTSALDSSIGSNTQGEERLNYIRGDRNKEGQDIVGGYTTSKPYRERKSAQGDIVNSDVWYTGTPIGNHSINGYATFTKNQKSRAPMLYVGGNDGMLHGFSAATGEEKIAYVPKGVIPKLRYLTDPAFDLKHKYFVDGSPMTGDVDVATPANAADAPTHAADWRTVLVGTLGAGGKGYFALDVTNPENFKESNAKDLVLLDRTAASDEERSCPQNDQDCAKKKEEERDIGFITGKVAIDNGNSMRTSQIARLNNNRWAAVLGNGINSKNQRPVLLIQYLDGDKELLRIPATTDNAGTGQANDNGLATPTLVDINNDGRPDVVYAGDNLGNLWKFDLTAATQAEWEVAFSGSPLFTAMGPGNNLANTTRTTIQPISTPPLVKANNRTQKITSGSQTKTISVGGVMVAFGTGRNITKTDQDSNEVQTLYSVLDNTRYDVDGSRLSIHKTASGTCSPLPLNNCVPAPKALGTGVSTAKLAKRKSVDKGNGLLGIEITDTLDETTWNQKNGWYIDFPAVGERLLKPLQFYDNSNIMAIYSQVPAKGSDADPNIESCESSSVDVETQYLRMINIMDGLPSSTPLFDANGDGLFTMVDMPIIGGKVTKGAHNLITQGNKILDFSTKPGDDPRIGPRMPEAAIRPSWRQFN